MQAVEVEAVHHVPAPAGVPTTQMKEINNFFLDIFDMGTSPLSSKLKNTWKTTSEDFKLSQFVFSTKNT